ncbi:MULTISPECIES: hypothetical protein [Aphanothece]|uniref:hypothetical protein n=1 Tax=Aphanothece TaxID=1121 RepID=UPI0039856339
MVKDEISRAEELQALGWTAEDVRRYEELWEYRQRWGAINLEPEDRAFLRRAEAALPKRPASGKGAQKKTLQEKSHYRWLAFHLDAMKASPVEQDLAEGEAGAWRILLEQELRVLDHYEPVLGLPDTLKARDLQPLREQWIGEVAGDARLLEFDFAAPLEELRQRESTSWKPLRGEGNDDRRYPVLAGEAAENFRRHIHQELARQIRASFPSLKDSGKPEPPAP